MRRGVRMPSVAVAVIGLAMTAGMPAAAGDATPSAQAPRPTVRVVATKDAALGSEASAQVAAVSTRDRVANVVTGNS